MRIVVWIQCKYLYILCMCLLILYHFMVVSHLCAHPTLIHLCTHNSNEYFQDILNRIVITVMFSMISPLQAANLVYGCANILGMDLLQELPQRTLIITGMRKTNDLKRGHDFIIRAFKPFGKIEEAAIAPSNRGFGKSSHSISV